MKITNVETVYVRLPMWFKYAGGTTVAEGRAQASCTGSLIVKIHTDEGIVGLGDIIVKGGRTGDGEAAKRYVESALVPVLIGADLFAIAETVRRLWTANLHHSSIYVAGIDIALHDLVGKALGVPIYQLLGGQVRERVPLTWNVPADQDIDLMVKQAADAVEHGFTNVIKVKTGTPWDVAALTRIQQAVGDVPLRPDDNGAFLAGDSIVRFRTAREQGVRFELLEQPAPNHDLRGLKRVADALGERVAYHVGYVERPVAAELLQQRLADAVSVPVFRHGIHEAVQMMRAFELVGVGCLMGSGLEGPIAATAAVHVATAIRNVCYPIDTLGPLWFSERILNEPLTFEQGFAVAPNGPGLGISLDEQQVEKLRVA
jgi:muconate cycloisomerase